jgi:hypothetical protein
MTRPWVAVEAAIRVNHKLVALPSDSARWGWVCILGEAKQQRPAGAFRSMAHLREAAGRFARFIGDYQKQGLLEASAALCVRCAKRWPSATDGMIVVHDWHVHQVDPGAAKRAKDWREADERTDTERETNEKSSFVDTDPSRALSLSLSTSLSETNPREPYQVPTAADDVWRVVGVIEDLVGSFGYSRGSKVFDRMADDVAQLGPDRVETAYRSLRAEFASDPMDAAGIVYGGHKRLFPIPDGPRPSKAAAKPKGFQPDADEVVRAFGG